MEDRATSPIPPEERPGRKLTVFIVDSQPLYRQALRAVLKEEADVIGESALSADVWMVVENLAPEVALVDVGLPLLEGFGVARQIARRCPKVAVVMMSPTLEDDQLFQAIKLGAAAFLSKYADCEEILDVLRRVRAGQYPINDSLMARPNTAVRILQLFHQLSAMGSDVDSLVTPLSHREKEILRLIAEGNSNKRIAGVLGVEEQTVKNYTASIMRKLNANDRTHAVVLAIRKGWLNIGEISDLPITERLRLQQS